MGLLAEHRPDDVVLSEEGKDDKVRLEADRVWIVDPLDGTREFSEPPRDDWAVHVALWARTSSGPVSWSRARWPSPASVRRSTPAGHPSYLPRRRAARASSSPGPVRRTS